MANALTTTQIEILRRLRDGIDLASEPWLTGLLADVSFLRHLGLVELQGVFDVTLSENGRRYLTAAERESSDRLASLMGGHATDRHETTRAPAMKPGPTDTQVLQRLDDLIAQTMKRCGDLERAIAAGLASGFDTAAADVALVASYRALALYKEKLAGLERRMGHRPGCT